MRQIEGEREIRRIELGKKEIWLKISTPDYWTRHDTTLNSRAHRNATHHNKK
jgi:hypothetical protein